MIEQHEVDRLNRHRAADTAMPEFPAELSADLALLRQVLSDRGWRVDPDDAWCWRWPVPQPAGLDLFRAGPLILFDEEDPDLGFLVESPLLRDGIEAVLRYGSVPSLIKVLDRVETWRYPQGAAEIDPDQVVLPVAWSEDRSEISG